MYTVLMCVRFVPIGTIRPGLNQWLLMILAIPQDVSAIHGTMFLVAVPKLTVKDNPELKKVTFNVASIFETPVKITFQFVHIDEPGRDVQQTVIARGDYYTYVVNNTLLNETDLVRKGVFKIDGDERFGLTVLMYGSHHGLSTFTAVPVEAWGTDYFAMTLDFNPAIQIISAENPTRIEVTYRITYDWSMPNYTFEGSIFLGDRKTQRFRLRSFEAVSISHCPDTPVRAGTLSGSHISGREKFGVVSGSCSTVTDTAVCGDTELNKFGKSYDPATEMLTPTSLWGTEFIVMTMPVRVTQGFVRVINDDKPNVVNRTLPDRMSFYKSGMLFSGEFWTDFNFRINSLRPIQVAYVQVSACLDTTNLSLTAELTGDASICMLIPNQLFFVLYIWRLPQTHTKNYAALVTEKDYQQFLTLDDVPFSTRLVWQNVCDIPTYSIGHLELPSRYHEVGSSKFNNFGCYFYGLGKEVTFMHPGEFRQADCQPDVDPIEGDLLDNDCDGFVDEEEVDYADNDNDDMIDEDTRNSKKGDGQWGAWGEWSCIPECFHTILVRERHCDDPPPKAMGMPCVGDINEFLYVKCQPKEALNCSASYQSSVTDMHPSYRVCDKGRWGPNCSRYCTKCVSDCDERTGACKSCQQGFKNAAGGCDQVCEENEYGYDCVGSCTEKCGNDCVDRITGACPSRQVYLLLLLLVPPAGVLMLLLSKKYSEQRGISKPAVETSPVEVEPPRSKTLDESLKPASDIASQTCDYGSTTGDGKFQDESRATSARTSSASLISFFGSEIG